MLSGLNPLSLLSSLLVKLGRKKRVHVSACLAEILVWGELQAPGVRVVPCGKGKAELKEVFESESALSDFSFRSRGMIVVQYTSRSRGSFICTMISSTLL